MSSEASNSLICYEDNHLWLVYKQPGEPVQADRSGDTPLIERIKSHIKQRDQKPGAVLAIVGPAHLDAGNLGNGVGAVRCFQRTCQQVFFLHRLGRVLGIDAGGTEVEQFFHSCTVRGVDDVRRDYKVVVDEFRLVCIVCENTADGRSCQKNIIRSFLFE